MIVKYNQKLKDRSRELRIQSTLSEVLLWNQIKSKNLGVQFLRQKPIGNYIVDFYCPLLKLVIEIDGFSHDTKQDYDKFRDEFLMMNGLHIIRFNNMDVKTNIGSVIKDIRLWIAENSFATFFNS